MSDRVVVDLPVNLFENVMRDGCFDEDQLFAVWEPEDVRALIVRLTEALEQSEGRS